MKWTAQKPNRDGWWWMRVVVGSILTEKPVHLLTMRGKKAPSIYFAGEWRDIAKVGNDARVRWSDKPIRRPDEPRSAKGAAL